jgi:hypothetical protein
MAEVLTERKSPTKLSYGVHANYKHGPFDRLEERIAKLQVPAHLPEIPNEEANGLVRTDEGLIWLAKPGAVPKQPAVTPRYNFAVTSKPDEPLPKRTKLSDEDSSSSSEVPIVEPPVVTALSEDKLAALFGSLMPEVGQVPEEADDPLPADEDYESDPEPEKEAKRPAREKKVIDRYMDEDQKDLDDDDSPKKKKSAKKGKQSVVLRDVDLYDSLEQRFFSIMGNPENERRLKLTKKDGRMIPRRLNYDRLDICQFVNPSHLAWKVWRFHFAQASLTALANHLHCPSALAKALTHNQEYSRILAQWTKNACLEFDRAAPTLPICVTPKDVEVPCCSILRIVEMYRIIEFKTMLDPDQHVVRFRSPREAEMPYTREFQVPSAALAQILQLHSIFYPFQMMIDMATTGFFSQPIVVDSEEERRECFETNAAAILEKTDTPLQQQLTSLALHCFKNWWFYQRIFNIQIADTLIREREAAAVGQNTNTPTLTTRRTVGF